MLENHTRVNHIKIVVRIIVNHLFDGTALDMKPQLVGEFGGSGNQFDSVYMLPSQLFEEKQF